MKRTPLLAALLLTCSLAAIAMPPGQNAPAATAAAAPLAGKVLETKDAAGYTYLRLKTRDGEIWAAVPGAEVKVGADVTIANPQVMNGFQSKSLNKTFDRIVFGTLGGANAAAQPAPDLKAMHAGTDQAAAAVKDVKVEKAKGPDAQTVAGIVTGADKLKDKPVVVRGQVVKFSGAIMGKNWVHLRDGTGTTSDRTNDVLVVTDDTARVGEVVLVKGTVRTDRNLGMGYSYKVLVEDAKLTK